MTPSPPPLVFHRNGCWLPGQVHVRWISSSWPTIAELNAMIDRAWCEANERGGMHLFDGPMCRLESIESADDELTLCLSRTSYKVFYGTNLTHPEIADQFGSNALARPVGVSPALISADNFLLLGRRNSAVAYYPNRLHPFAGALEPTDDLDVFANVRRELHEELSLRDEDIAEMACTGLVEDTCLRHPELIFAVRCNLTRPQIERQVHAEEHDNAWSVPATADAIATALAGHDAFTPVAGAAMLLFGRIAFGQSWFEAHKSNISVAAGAS